MNTNPEQIEEIEANQKALRDSIEHSKRLAEKTDALIQKHKETLQETEPARGLRSPWD